MKNDAWNPNQYDKFKDERSRPFFDLMSLIQDVKNPKVIDLGCGTGELTSQLHKTLNSQDTVGFDSSDEMLAKAKQLETSGLHFEKGNIETFTEQSKYDVLFSNAAVQWCANHPALLKKFKESLKPGGQLAIQMPMNHDYPTHTLAIEMSKEQPLNSQLGGQSYSVDQLMLTAQDYATHLFKLGFTEQKVFVRVYGHILDSREGVIEWVSGTTLTYFKSRLSKEDYAVFLTQYKDRLFKILKDEKPFFYPFKRVFIWGRLP